MNKQPWEIFREEQKKCFGDEISEQEIKEAFEERQREIVANKKPAHQVVVEMIRETVASLNDQSEPFLEVESIPILMKVGILSALFEVLKRMTIPEKHFEEVWNALWEIRKNCPELYAEKLIPEKFVLKLMMSQPQKWNEQSWNEHKNEILGA